MPLHHADTRHHEGFSLYDTKGLTDYDVMHTPAGRDLVREFVDACRRYDLLPVFYHTTLDWLHPDFNNDFNAYLDYLYKSVEILCTNYGKIGGLWFDGNWSRKDADWKTDRLYKMIRKNQPDAMIIDNTGLQRRGEIEDWLLDAVTYEQGRPEPMNREGMPKYLAAEMCHTTNDHWGIGKDDYNYKSMKELIESLCSCRKVGANYLLNIGPTAQGGIEPMQAAILGLLGRWMRFYGEAIYHGRPFGAKAEESAKNFALRSEDAIYLFIHDVGRNGSANVVVDGRRQGDCYFDGISGSIAAIEWMDNGESLGFEQDGDRLTLHATSFPYGLSTCVRVAKATLK